MKKFLTVLFLAGIFVSTHSFSSQKLKKCKTGCNHELENRKYLARITPTSSRHFFKNIYNKRETCLEQCIKKSSN